MSNSRKADSRRAPDDSRRNTRGRFEQWAQNPACQANTISAVHNVKMAEVADRARVPYTNRQSPFALARGSTFENGLLRNEAERLREALIEREVLPPTAFGFRDLRIQINGGPEPDLEAAIESTRRLLEETAAGVQPPAVAAGATLRIPRGVMLPEAILILDVLAIRHRDGFPELVVGEVKTYPDRGGHTDPHELAVARAQAGLYVHALQLTLDAMSLQNALTVCTSGFLVLSRPGSNFPSVRADEDLRFQAERARRGFELLESAARRLPPVDAAPGDLIDMILESAFTYSEACLGFCELAARCHAEAVAAGSGAILGDDVQRFLGEISLNRAVALLRGEDPLSEAEADLGRRIKETDWLAGA